MKQVISFIAIAVSALLSTTNGVAEDGWLFSAKPPIVVRRDVDSVTYNFTNTSDKPVHGVAINSIKNGQPQSVVIIDTIEPHKTVALDWARVIESAGGHLSDATITCTGYSSPIKLTP